MSMSLVAEYYEEDDDEEGFDSTIDIKEELNPTKAETETAASSNELSDPLLRPASSTDPAEHSFETADNSDEVHDYGINYVGIDDELSSDYPAVDFSAAVASEKVAMPTIVSSAPAVEPPATSDLSVKAPSSVQASASELQAQSTSQPLTGSKLPLAPTLPRSALPDTKTSPMIAESPPLVAETTSAVSDLAPPVVKTTSPVMDSASAVIDSASPVIDSTSPVVDSKSPASQSAPTVIPALPAHLIKSGAVIPRPSSTERGSGSGSEDKSRFKLVSYGDDETSDDESLSDMEIDTDEVPLAKDQVVNLNLYSSGVPSPSPSKHPEAEEPTVTVPAAPTSAFLASTEKWGEVTLPPEPDGRCSRGLQEKIIKMIEKRQAGWDINRYIQDKKEFRNPSIYEKLISHVGIDEYGTNYPRHLYDPTIWTEEDHYEALARKQKEYHDKKEKEKQKRAHVEFISGTKKVTTSAIASTASAKTSSSTAKPTSVKPSTASIPSKPLMATLMTSQAALSEPKRSKWDVIAPPADK